MKITNDPDDAVLTVHVEKVKEEKAGEDEESESPESEESADVAPKKEAGSQ